MPSPLYITSNYTGKPSFYVRLKKEVQDTFIQTLPTLIVVSQANIIKVCKDSAQITHYFGNKCKTSVSQLHLENMYTVEKHDETFKTSDEALISNIS